MDKMRCQIYLAVWLLLTDDYSSQNCCHEKDSWTRSATNILHTINYNTNSSTNNTEKTTTKSKSHVTIHFLWIKFGMISQLFCVCWDGWFGITLQQLSYILSFFDLTSLNYTDNSMLNYLQFHAKIDGNRPILMELQLSKVLCYTGKIQCQNMPSPLFENISS